MSGAGDVNGDGIGDVIIGARSADPGNRTSAGETYVVFGSDGGFVGMDSFGASAPYKELYEHFGITAEAIVALAQAKIAESEAEDA